MDMNDYEQQDTDDQAHTVSNLKVDKQFNNNESSDDGAFFNPNTTKDEFDSPEKDGGSSNLPPLKQFGREKRTVEKKSKRRRNEGSFLKLESTEYSKDAPKTHRHTSV